MIKRLVAVAAALVFLPVLMALGAAGESWPNLSTSIDEHANLSSAVLRTPAIALTSIARRDIDAGVVDPRVLETLLAVSRNHSISVGVLSTGHSYFVKGTNRPSNHVFGRAVDIVAVDGVAVSKLNSPALSLALEVAQLPEPLRPDEIGSPWKLDIAGSFTDRMHTGHIHLGWRAK